MDAAVGRSPAEVYDERFVPALFGPWARVVAERARIASGQRVLDVACGTGALAREAAERVGPRGSVTGLDANPAMLGVARSKPLSNVQWVDGRAEALPFDADAFDAVVSQFGMMFFDDPAGALREMQRVLRPGGRLAVAVCDAVDRSPGYAVFAELLQRLFGARVAEAFRAPFVLGDAARLHGYCAAAGIEGADVSSVDGSVRFASIDDLVSAERACAWTLGGLLDEAQFERLRTESRASLRRFAQDDGTLAFVMPALVVTAVKQDHAAIA